MIYLFACYYENIWGYNSCPGYNIKSSQVMSHSFWLNEETLLAIFKTPGVNSVEGDHGKVTPGDPPPPFWEAFPLFWCSLVTDLTVTHYASVLHTLWNTSKPLFAVELHTDQILQCLLH